MTFLTIVDRMAGITLARIGARFDGVKKFEIPLVPLFLNGVSPLVTVQTEIFVGVALVAILGIVLGVDLVLGDPVHLVAFGLWKLAVGMTTVAILRAGKGRVRIVVADVTPESVDLFAVGERFRIGVTVVARERRRLEKRCVHFVGKDIKGVPLFLLRQKRERGEE